MTYRFDKKELQKMVDKGYGITMAAAELGCNSGTLRDFCKATGFVFPKQSTRNKGPRPANAQECKLTKGFNIHSPMLRTLWA